jgi:hypothetical protein
MAGSGGRLTVPTRPPIWPWTLVRHSFAVWNLEYQRVGDHPEHGGGGWLATCLDLASAIDLLAATGQTLAAGRLDLSRVVAIGHSFEISADDGPTRDWVFDGQRRGASGSAGRAAAPDFAVRFTISG